MESIEGAGALSGHPRTFRFRWIESSWGIAIDLEAMTHVSVKPPARATQVSARTWLDLSSVKAGTADLEFLVAGLARVAGQIESQRTDNTTVEVLTLDFTPTDYQPEGMAAAIVGWATEEFNLPEPSVEISFDPGQSRYLFDWRD